MKISEDLKVGVSAVFFCLFFLSGPILLLIFLTGHMVQQTSLIIRGVPVPGTVVSEYDEVLFTGEDFIQVEAPIVRYEGNEGRLDSHMSYKVGDKCIVLYDKQTGQAVHLGSRDNVVVRLWVCKLSVFCLCVIGIMFGGGVASQVYFWLQVMAPNLKLLSEMPKSFSMIGDRAKAIEQICVSLLIVMLWLALCWYGYLEVITFKSDEIFMTGVVALLLVTLSWVSLPAVWHWIRHTGVNHLKLKPWLHIGEMIVALYVCFQVARLFYAKNANPWTSTDTIKNVIADLLHRVLGA